MKQLVVLILLFPYYFLSAQIPVSMGDNMRENKAEVEQKGNELDITWPVANNEFAKLILDLEKDKPLISTIAMGSNGDYKVISSNIDPVFFITVGKRTLKPETGWDIFFDKVPTRPFRSYLMEFEKKEIKVNKNGSRTVIEIGEISAPDFKGNIEITVYNGSPLLNIAAVVTTQKDAAAILYDAGLVTEDPWGAIAFSTTADELQSFKTTLKDPSKNEAVKYRAIIGENEEGGIAVFPPPHQYFYPLDEAFNLKFVWHGTNYNNRDTGYGIGIRQDPYGDKRFVPWFNAPPGTAQRLNFFCLLGLGDAGKILGEVKKYTHGDKYVPLKGYKTMSSHFHNEFIMKVVLADKQVPEKPEFVDVFKELGVDIVHLGEFHYTAHPKGPDQERLLELKALFDQCMRLSDDEFLLLPGEEPNEFFGGHWMNFFPRPVYWIMSRDAGKPFVSDDPKYGKVYRIADKTEMLKLLKLENGLAWTAHARIKGSTGFPDRYKEEKFFLSETFLGAAWKPIPADLSIPKLGMRVFDLMDDMNNWGLQKKVIAEADLFTVTFENEMYAHMNVNYLQLDKLPGFSDGWQPVLDAMSAGRFFSTTGEILIPSFAVNGKKSGETIKLNNKGNAKISMKIDWTFPLNFVEIISGDGEQVYRKKINMDETESFGSKQFEFSENLAGRKWLRVEVWDAAANGAFTQTVYLE